MTDVTLGLRFTADQRELQQAADKGSESVRKLGDEAKKSNEQAARAAQQHTDALKSQADTLGMSRSQVMAYEAAQHKMTDAQRQSVQQSITAIDAYERKQAMLGRVATAAKAAGAAIGVAFVVGVKSSIAAAAEAERSQLRLEAVLKATRHAAGLTGDQLERIASEMQDSMGIDDEAIKDSMAVMLTFRQVTRESFGDAMKVAANLAAVMGTDLKSATLQLGKALEDPEQGLSALTRSGISFSDSQKRVIKDLAETGRQGEAVTQILTAMREQGLEGVAQAMNAGLSGALNNNKIAWGELFEGIGKTNAVGGTAKGVLNGITEELRGMKSVIESGDWVDLLDSLFTPQGQQTVRMRNRAAAAADTAAQDARELSRGDVAGSRDRISAERRVAAARDKATEFMAQFQSDNQKLQSELKKWSTLADTANMTLDERARGEAAIRAKHAKKGGEDSKAGQQLINSLTEQLAQASGEATAYDKVMRQVTTGVQKFTEAEIAAALALAGEIDEMTRAKVVREAHIKSAQAMVEQQDRVDQVIASVNESMSDQAQSLQLEISLMGASDAQREKAIALRELDNKFRRDTVNLQGEELDRAYALFNVERERISGLLDERGTARAQKKATEDAREAQKRFNDDLARGLTDSIFRGFEGGKSFAKNFWDSLKNTAKTTVLQPVVKFLVSPLTSAVGGGLGALGLPGMANASGGAGGLGGLFGGGNPMSWIMNGGGIAGEGGLMGALGGIAGVPNAIFQNAGVSTGSQFIADIGNFGYGAPVMAGVMNLLAGNTRGAIASTGLGVLGTAVGGPIGGMIGSALGSLVGGGKKQSAYLVGKDIPSGNVSYGSGLSGAVFGNSQKGDRWLGESWSNVFTNEIQGVYDEIERLGKQLGRDTSGLRGFNATITTGSFMEPVEVFNTVIQQTSDQLARQLIPNLSSFAQAGESATQTLTRMIAMQEQLQGQLQDSVRALPGQLGITSLEGTRNALAMSEYVAPTDRLAKARSLLSETYNRGLGGDLDAVNSYGSQLQQALTLGRSVGASGPAFQALFTEGNKQLNELLSKQQSVQSEMLQGIDVSIIEASKDQVAELRKGFKALVDAVNELRGEVARSAA